MRSKKREENASCISFKNENAQNKKSRYKNLFPDNFLDSILYSR